jgi:hypothetical protein
MRKLLQTTAQLAIRYLEGLDTRNVAPTEEARANLIQFDQPLPDEPVDAELVLQQHWNGKVGMEKQTGCLVRHQLRLSSARKHTQAC